MPGVLDADTHIAESEAMWSFIDKEMYPRRPVLAKIPDDTWYQRAQCFLADRRRDLSQAGGKSEFQLDHAVGAKEGIRPGRHPSRRARTHRSVGAPQGYGQDRRRHSGDLSDIVSGLSHRRSEDWKSRYAAPTTALSPMPAAKAPNRLKWVAIPPLRDIEAALR